MPSFCLGRPCLLACSLNLVLKGVRNWLPTLQPTDSLGSDQEFTHYVHGASSRIPFEPWARPVDEPFGSELTAERLGSSL
jgi:hypothetical protein